MTAYTVEVYKKDARIKAGEKLIDKRDYTDVDRIKIESSFNAVFPTDKYRIEVHETYVTKKNMMTGAEFQERYDTSYYCSPSSEAYWSM